LKNYRLCSDVRFRIVSSEAIVIRQSTPEVLVLNEWGGRILELLGAGNSTTEVMQTMLQEYDVQPNDLQRDLTAFLGEMQEAGIIEEL
jgi:hypothetical protein